MVAEGYSNQPGDAMTTGYEDPTREQMFAEIVFREGTPEEWGGEFGGYESYPTLERHIRDYLDLARGSSDEDDALIRRVIIAEQDRQSNLIAQYNREQELLRREREFRARVADKVTGLADAFERFVASGNRAQLETDLYEAFRTEDNRTQHERAIVESHFRPIG